MSAFVGVAPRPIVVLSQDVVDRIAAGEVVQRPSAALKELLENSLDAGAQQINVTCQDGGLTLLQIRDDGCGIAAKDLPLLCERFATSKLRTFDDLATMSTFGFRGEALASMSHVARVSVVTRTAADEHAWEAHYDAGAMTSGPTPCAGAVGTTLTVADLFYNTPLRKRAFARSNDEYVKICDIITRYAMNRPGIGFSCQRVGAPRLDVSVPKTCADTRAVVANRFGESVAKYLVPIQGEQSSSTAPSVPSFRFDGWVTTLSYTGKRSHMTLFVNGRLVGCTSIQRAVDHVYAPFLVAGAKSFVVLNVQVDPSRVDVNVHPTKHEVLLLDEEDIVRAVFSAIKPVLTSLANARDVGSSGGGKSLPTVAVASTPQLPFAAPSSQSTQGVSYLSSSSAMALTAPIRARGDVQRGSMDKFLVPFSTTATSKPVVDVAVPTRKAFDVDADEEDDSHNTHVTVLQQPSRPQPPVIDPSRDMNAVLSSFFSQRATDESGRDDDGDDEDDDDAVHRNRLVAQITAASAEGMVAAPSAALVAPPCDCEQHTAPSIVAVPIITDEETGTLPPVDVEALASVANILTSFDGASNNTLRDISSKMTFVGQIDDQRLLIQSGTTLYLAHSRRFLYEAALQMVFLRWGHLPRYRLSTAANPSAAGVPIDVLLDLSLQLDEGLRAQCPTAELRAAAVAACVSQLANWSDMLADYFGIVIDASCKLLKELPAPLGVMWPLPVRAVPLLLVRIATVVDYSDEERALRGIAREVALFAAAASVDSDVPLREAIKEACTRRVKLPAALAADGCLQAIVTVEALYKVFERC